MLLTLWLSATGLAGGRPPKRLLPPLKFSKEKGRTIETIAHCFEETVDYCLPPPPPPAKFFSSRKPDSDEHKTTKQKRD